MLSTIALAISLVCSGLFAGLMLTLVIVLQRMWLTKPYARYVQSMQTFLPAAKGHPVITALTLIPIGLPLLTLVDRDAPSILMIALASIGAVASLLILLVTLRLNFPIYDAIMAWHADEPPRADWQSFRQRFYALNLVRFVLSFSAMLSFLIALIL